MKPANSAMQALTRRLLAHEAGENPTVDALADAAERAFDKLRLYLSKILGADGFHVLLRRAATLAQADFPWLKSVPAQSDGFLKGLAAAARASGAITDAEAIEGIFAVPAHFLRLLEEFIGQDLSLSLLQGIWPEVDVLPQFDPDRDVDPAISQRGGKLGEEETTR